MVNRIKKKYCKVCMDDFGIFLGLVKMGIKLI